MPDADVASAREAVLREFRWVGGHSDMWRLAEDAATFATVIDGLAALASKLGPTAVAGIETRGVLFGAPVARALGLGFHTIRKTDGLFAGAVHEVDARPDYRGRSHTLRSRGRFAPGDSVVLVDDWIETGNQAAGARRLVESAGANVVGVVVIVDQSTDASAVRALVRATELPQWRGE